MVTKNIFWTCITFTVLGLIAIIVGVTLLVRAGKDEEMPDQPVNMNAIILRFAGRVVCISGGVLLACTLSTGFYLCTLGGSNRQTSEPSYSACSSQLSKAVHIRQVKTLASAASAAGHRWPVNEALMTHSRERPVPGGDVYHASRASADTKTNNSNVSHYESTAPDTSSNCVFNYPRYPELSPRNSLVTGYPFIKTSTARATSGVAQSTSERRLWMPPNLNSQPGMSQTMLAPELGGYQLEPLGSVLHPGGRLRSDGTNT